MTSKIVQLFEEYDRSNADKYVETICASLGELPFHERPYLDPPDKELFIVSENGEHIHILHNQDVFTIGRSSSCDITINNTNISRIQCIVINTLTSTMIFNFSDTGIYIVRRSAGPLENALKPGTFIEFGHEETFTILLGMVKNPVFLSFTPYHLAKDCIICLSNKRCIWLSCGHGTMCESCYQQSDTTQCPICRAVRPTMLRLAAQNTYCPRAHLRPIPIRPVIN